MKKILILIALVLHFSGYSFETEQIEINQLKILEEENGYLKLEASGSTFIGNIRSERKVFNKIMKTVGYGYFNKFKKIFNFKKSCRISVLKIENMDGLLYIKDKKKLDSKLVEEYKLNEAKKINMRTIVVSRLKIIGTHKNFSIAEVYIKGVLKKIKILFLNQSNTVVGKVFVFNKPVTIYELFINKESVYEKSKVRLFDYYLSFKEAREERFRQRKLVRQKNKENKIVSALRVVTDLTSYVGKKFTIEGKINLSKYYYYGYKDCRKSHFSFEIMSKNEKVYVYIPKKDSMGISLRERILRDGSFKGIFKLHLSKYSKNCSNIMADLVFD